ncbi:S41 family peptidase [Microbacterium sp. ASV49]|uniref:S41 family peptidase n=1 Tax=Microbacterium candidum TaxID=3041922 RepID=A0ABT7N2Q3_9MICO|nr:S41 family peptidase [Microbacterium sp. ASV49]MDL9980984.1 S41 family peptidase [Microbacterium sp. ASV49]
MLIDRIQDLVREHYVFPDIAAAIADGLDGFAVDETDGPAAAEALTAALQEVNGDRHLRVRYFPAPIAPEPDPREVIAELVRENGPGVTEVRRLPGNEGLLAIGPVIPTGEYAGPAISAALTLLQGVSPLIIDLRGCLGGVPETVSMIVSHLTGDEPVHVQDLVRRDGGVTQFWTATFVSPKVDPDIPVYVLTSARTFSGGEELAYDLQALGRAIVVGERTGGGAHPREDFELTPHLQLHVPTARSVNAVTGANWEGVGVVPDIACAAVDALDVALNHAGTDATTSGA